MSATIIHIAYPPARGILRTPAASPAALPLLALPSAPSSAGSSPSPAALSSPDYFPSPSAPSPPLPLPKSRSASPAARRIRFAPLPEPRRDEPALDAPADALSLGLRVPFDDRRRDRSPRLTPAPTPASESAPTLLTLGSTQTLTRVSSNTTITAPGSVPTTPNTAAFPAADDAPADCDLVGTSPRRPAPELPTDSPRKHKWSKKLLKPLLGPLKSTPACADEPGPDLAAAKKRSRSGSRGKGDPPDWVKEFGQPLGRWQSDDQPRRRAPKGGVEFTRTQSLDREREALAAGLALARTGSGASAAGRKQQRMLNGRVYGAKRAPKNPFANAKAEPEFVEWGYGGTGSVQAARTGANYWAKVQASGSLSVGATEASAGWSAGRRPGSAGAEAPAPRPPAPAAEDDGSGMAWVRRRREQREREKAEQAGRAQELGQPENAPASPAEAPKTDAQEHVTTTVTVPAHHRHHSHESHHEEARAPSVAREEEEEGSRTPSDEEASPAEEGSGEDERESESPRPEDEEELEEEVQELRRLTARGAGVEKISRHKDAGAPSSPP